MKNKILSTLVFCFSSFMVWGQHNVDNQGAIFFTTTPNRIGLRMSNPDSPVHSLGKLKISWPGNVSRFLEFTHGGTNGFVNTSFGRFDFRVNGSNKLSVLPNGNVGVGTINAESKLSVKGKIESQEVQVKAVVADYVFTEEHQSQMPSLEELETYIQENNHLPRIQTQEDVDNNRGLVKLGELSVSLMEKVEELTLHLIEVNKRLKQVESENKALKEEVAKINE